MILFIMRISIHATTILRINLVYNNVCSSLLLVESSTIGHAHLGGHLAAVEGHALTAEQVLGARLSCVTLPVDPDILPIHDGTFLGTWYKASVNGAK